MPYTSQQTARNELHAQHAKFDKSVLSGMAKSVSGIDDNLSSQEFASIIKIYCKNLSADECFAHARNVEANIDRIRKSAGIATDASRDIDIERQYEKAYMFYLEAANKGNEVGQANCAILLANLRFKKYGIWGHNINYILAAFYFEDLVKKSKNPKVLKVSYSCLSALYQRGGYGLDKDPQKAQKYLQLARKY